MGLVLETCRAGEVPVQDSFLDGMTPAEAREDRASTDPALVVDVEGLKGRSTSC